MSRQIILSALLLGLLSCAMCMVVISSEGTVDVDSNSNLCARGPSYWCSHISNAKSCHAVKHCIQTVWERQIIPEDEGDGICDICKEMVQEARDQLMSNETQEELREVFEGSCKFIPIKLISMECIKVFDGFIPELIEMLASQMNPAIVCTTAGLCNSEWSDRLQAEYQSAKLAELDSKNAKCNQCNSLMSPALEKIQHKSKEDVLSILFDMCGRLSSLSDSCHAIVLDNIEEIYQFLQTSLQEKNLCQPYGLCDLKLTKSTPRVDIQPMSNDAKFEARMPSVVVSGKEDLECEFCQALVKHVREIMTSNTTEEEFKQVMLALCKQTGSFAKQCASLTTQYYDVIYGFLAEEMDPEQVCRLLTLCANPGLLGSSGVGSWYLNIRTAPAAVPLTRLFPAEKISESRDVLVGQDESNAKKLLTGDSESQLPIERLVPPSVVAASVSKNPGCIFCEYVLHQIVDELHNTTVDKNIEQIVKNVCDHLPSAISNECDKFVDNYGDALLFLLSQELDPSVMCATLQLCPGAEKEGVVLPAKPFKASTGKDPNICALCEFVITELDHRLEDNKTEEAVKQALESVCGYLPKTVRKDCTRLVDGYADQILEMILADLTPDEVCAALKLCSPKDDGTNFKTGRDVSVGDFLAKMQVEPFHSAAKAKEVKIKVVSPATCIMCEFAMKELDKLLITNSTEEQVKRTIYFVCGHLPDTIADMCIDFVEQYGDEIFDMLVKQMAPKEVCSEMGLCTAVSLHNKPKLLGQDERRLESGLVGTCPICETIVEYLDKLLEDDTIEESIDQLVAKSCNIIPLNAQAKCKGIVDTYGPYLLHQLGQLMDKTKVCQSVHLCKPPAGQVQLLGGKFCTFGPAYWCVSKEHAIACNELEHCQTKEWMKPEP